MTPEFESQLAETHRRLGAFIFSMAAIDTALLAVFAALHGDDFREAATAYYGEDNVFARQRMTDDLVREVLVIAEDREKWTELFQEHREIYRWRNRLVHDSWAIVPGEGYRLIDAKPAKGEGDMLHIFQDIDDARLEDLRRRADVVFGRLHELAWLIRNAPRQR
jgi:hypothetical protein